MYLAALTALVTVGGVGLLSTALKNRWPGKKKIKAELAKLKADTLKLLEGVDLVPLGGEELDAFSPVQENKTLKRGTSITAKGVFVTIFHEAIMAYSYKKYMGGNERNNALLYMKTKKHHFTYYMQKEGIELHVDSNPVGTIKKDGKLYGLKTKKVLVSLGAKREGLQPVMIYDREVGCLTSTEEEKTVTPRAFQFMKDDLSKEEKLLFLAVAGFQLVMRGIEK